MRSLAVAVVVAGLCFSGIAQQQKNPYKAKHSPSEKPARKTAVPLPKAGSSGTSSSANAKDLQTLERQSSRNSAHPAVAKVPKSAAVRPLKESKSTPIKVGGTNANGGTQIRRPANPYKGRLKQKYTHQ